MRFYKLDENRQVVPCKPSEWFARFKDRDARRLAYDKPAPFVEVETMFLGVDQRFDNPVPMVFETNVLRKRMRMDWRRYATVEDALAGHAELVAAEIEWAQRLD